MDDFLPCAGCKELKVLKLGDYCLACALEPAPDYIIVKPDSLEHAALRSGITREYLNAKQERAFENYQVYVIYFAKDEWQEITISERLPVAVVMKNLLEKHV